MIASFILIAWPAPVHPQAGYDDKGLMNLKSYYDVADEGTGLKSATEADSRKSVMLTDWEYSLLFPGYFTLGTNMGSTASIFDDHCEITFGHPFAYTSFPYLVVDGERKSPIDLASNSASSILRIMDTLKAVSQNQAGVNYSFSIYPGVLNEICLELNVFNMDSEMHEVGLGLIFDAALGKWGDGSVYLGDHFADSTASLDGNQADSLLICERNTVPGGLRIKISFDEKPDSIQIRNWPDLFRTGTGNQKIYDLALNAAWPDASLLPGDTAGYLVRIKLLTPEIPAHAYIRWDLPRFLSIENQMIFPASLNTNVEIFDPGTGSEDLRLSIPETDNVYGWESGEPFGYEGNGLHYAQAEVRIPEIYDSLVIPVTIRLEQSGTSTDSLVHQVFVPAAPFSDTGLAVNIDSAYVSYGKANIRFQAIVEETGRILYNLHHNNVFLYENDDPLQKFSLQKDTTGGINSADIVFVLDVTGSMTEEIAMVRDNIIEFADSLSYGGIDYRLGMVTFLDEIENIYEFTGDVQEFQLNVSEQYAHGGDDTPENSLDALTAASQFDFRTNAKRIIIWITDANFHISDDVTQQTREAVIDQLLAEGIQVFCIGNPEYQTDYYDQIVLNTGGSYFSIYGNFRDILLEVSRLNQALYHLLSFTPAESLKPSDVFTVEVHHAGLGGSARVSIGSAGKSATEKGGVALTVYPNPFYATPVLFVSGKAEYTYELELYNVTGQLIAADHIEKNYADFTYDMSVLFGDADQTRSQIYILIVRTKDRSGATIDQQSMKIGKF